MILDHIPTSDTIYGHAVNNLFTPTPFHASLHGHWHTNGPARRDSSAGRRPTGPWRAWRDANKLDIFPRASHDHTDTARGTARGHGRRTGGACARGGTAACAGRCLRLQSHRAAHNTSSTPPPGGTSSGRWPYAAGLLSRIAKRMSPISLAHSRDCFLC